MTYEEWEAGVPLTIRSDPLWRVQACRLALFASDLVWNDSRKMIGDARTRCIVDQLCRACGSISADITEGYARSTSRDRARFYEYALGSSRETRDWYYKSRQVLTSSVVEYRLELLTQIIKLLTAMVVRERKANRRVSDRSE